MYEIIVVFSPHAMLINTLTMSSKMLKLHTYIRESKKKIELSKGKQHMIRINSFAFGRCGISSKSVLSEHELRIQFLSASCDIAPRWMPQNTFDDKSTLDYIAISHYLNQCWAKSISPHGVTSWIGDNEFGVTISNNPWPRIIAYSSFEDQVPVRQIYGCMILNWFAETFSEDVTSL